MNTKTLLWIAVAGAVLWSLTRNDARRPEAQRKRMESLNRLAHTMVDKDRTGLTVVNG